MRRAGDVQTMVRLAAAEQGALDEGDVGAALQAFGRLR
jgi:hypothetical protein